MEFRNNRVQDLGQVFDRNWQVNRNNQQKQIQFIAIKSTKFFKNSQVKLFFGFYVLISFYEMFME